MTSFTVSTAQTASRSLGSGEFGIVTASGSITGDQQSAVSMTGGEMIVAGLVYGNSAAIALANFLSSIGHISIARSGVVGGPNDGVQLIGMGSAFVTNAGLITARDDGIYCTSDFVAINNSGEIHASILGSGIDASGTGAFGLVNAGLVWGASHGLAVIGSQSCDVTNEGEIAGQSDGIRLDSETATLFNSGTIAGSVGEGINATTTGAFNLTNTGTINGAVAGVQHSGGYCTIINTGVITGVTQALALGDFDSFVRNSGTIMGEIALGDGNGGFDGSLGSQSFISAGGGNDYVAGGAGSEYIDGGAGNDDLRGGGGGDFVEGYAGLDTIYGNDGDDNLNGVEDNDLLFGGAGDDTLKGDLGNDTLRGGNDDDGVYGGAASDSVYGGWGDDSVLGDTGIDRLYGGGGDDFLFGGSDRDTLYGGAGDDTMSGGSGVDVFLIGRTNGHDLITDFADNSDDLNLQSYDFANLAAVQARASDSSLGVLINLTTVGGGTVTLTGMTLAQLDANDLIL